MLLYIFLLVPCRWYLPAQQTHVSLPLLFDYAAGPSAAGAWLPLRFTQNTPSGVTHIWLCMLLRPFSPAPMQVVFASPADTRQPAAALRLRSRTISSRRMAATAAPTPNTPSIVTHTYSRMLSPLFHPPCPAGGICQPSRHTSASPCISIYAAGPSAAGFTWPRSPKTPHQV
jgi:hypothetical protein